ncbi:aminopeptidase [Periweissella fabaria]|uniref:Aminopeptidase PepS n=1 Tax=Periweissella fabaria TaxID=546157 RepID=A0ABM8Z7F1_9LACO|nr:aminopeptidase [Periweissella fabaria]MCM0597884.1 aminopeptidase [Periweissella fabaria]CAH0417335.1 Aminopeptidase PepS [Periweissella fabaria]
MSTNFELKLDKYADLIVKTGVNVQQGQTIILYADVENVILARKIVDAAYTAGANEVIVKWNDSHIVHAFLENTSDERLVNIPNYLTVEAEELMAKNASRISLISSDPDAYGDLDQERVAKFTAASGKALRVIRQATMSNDISWLVVAAAGQKWAEKVFPDLTGEAAVDRLWEEIFKVVRIDDTNDAIAGWDEHIKTLKNKATWLNELNFKELQYSSKVTNFTIGLAKDHIWEAADSVDRQGNLFVANMPTEEVFTSPDFNNIHGKVVSTKPLSYAGVLIEDIELTFENGQVIEAHASKGEEALIKLLDTDEGSRSLGEVSLVPFHSPISESGIVFFNTLIDENASDHLALGAAYPFNVKNGTTLDDDARQALGQNLSQTHVDFMIGSEDMNIDGITYDGQVVPVFRNGDWA